VPSATIARRPHSGPSRVGTCADWLLTAWFLAWALVFASTTLSTLANFALRQPSWDQYKEYATYLSQPFLASVLMLENGHHPVFPALIANVEILCCHADQYLQLAIGTLCVVLVCATIALNAWRQADLPRHMRAAGVMLAVLGVLWLGNARMLVQGVGQLQVYLVMTSVLLATLSLWLAAQSNAWRWIMAVSAACLVAMFTFGAGAASFPAMIVLGIALRVAWRKLLFLAGVALLGVTVYVFVLPGHDGVQHSLALRPLDSLVVAAQWLSSPWANAFLGLADPPLQGWLSEGLTDHVGRVLVHAANALAGALPWHTSTTLVGCAGILLFAVRLAMRYARREEFNRFECVATGLCLFGLMIAGVIAIGRLAYFESNLNQVFADRYLGWPCLFWMALALMLLGDAWRLQSRVPVNVALLFLVALPVVLLPTHRLWAGWAATVYRITQQSAAAARSDVIDDAVFPNGDDAWRSDVLRTLALLKRNRLAMFRDPGWELLGTQWTATPADGRFVASARVASRLADAQSGLPAARVEGVVSQGIATIGAVGPLAILDADSRVAGFAEFSFIASDPSGLRLNVPLKRGFDAYIRDFHADRDYRLVLLDTGAHRAQVLQVLSASR